MTVWVTGGRGMLGQAVIRALGRRHFSVHATDLDCDITDRDQVLAVANELLAYPPDPVLDAILSDLARVRVGSNETLTLEAGLADPLIEAVR